MTCAQDTGPLCRVCPFRRPKRTRKRPALRPFQPSVERGLSGGCEHRSSKVTAARRPRLRHRRRSRSPAPRPRVTDPGPGCAPRSPRRPGRLSHRPSAVGRAAQAACLTSQKATFTPCSPHPAPPSVTVPGWSPRLRKGSQRPVGTLADGAAMPRSVGTGATPGRHPAGWGGVCGWRPAPARGSPFLTP